MARRPRRKFRRPRRTRRKNAPTIKQLARRVKSMRPELKREIFAVTATSIVQTAGITDLNAFAQGITSSTRIGNKVHITGIEWEFLVNNVSATNSKEIWTRIMIVVDKRQVEATAPSADVIFETPLDPHSFKAFDETAAGSRISTVMDTKARRTVRISTGGNADKQQWKVKGFKKMNMNMYWSDATAANVEKNGLWLVVLSDNTVANENTMTGCVRVFYTDA